MQLWSSSHVKHPALTITFAHGEGRQVRVTFPVRVHRDSKSRPRNDALMTAVRCLLPRKPVLQIPDAVWVFNMLP